MKLIVANWKMNQTFSEIGAWLQEYLEAVSQNPNPLEECRVVVCPPFHVIEYIDSELINGSMTYLEEEVKKEGKTIDDFSYEEIQDVIMSTRAFSLGAQDCHHEENGAYTGDVSAKMLTEVGCEFVIVGHSERRTYHNESNQLIAKKIKSAINGNIQPVLCIGETKESRSKKEHLQFIEQQLLESLPQDFKMVNIIVAYEPVWSIGTGQIPTVEELAEVTDHITKCLNEKMKDKFENLYILYGGSISAKNSQNLLNVKGISGLLVGKASLNANEFCKIIGLKN